MAGNEQFRRYVEAGTAFIGMTQQRAEALVKDLVGSGEVARGQAQKVVERLVEWGQKGGEELATVVRREVRSQIESLGLATKDDIARLEARLADTAPPAAGSRKGAGPPVAKAAPRSKKGAPITKAASTRRPRSQSSPAAGD